MFRVYWVVSFAVQLFVVLCTVTAELVLFDAIGPFLSIGMLSISIVGCYVWKATRTEQWPKRQHILPLANRFGICWSVVSIITYVGLVYLKPESMEYDLLNLLWIVPVLGAAVWLGVSVITLCLGDLIATIFNTSPEVKSGSFRDHPSEYWRD